jgi:acetyl esterase/lipase
MHVFDVLSPLMSPQLSVLVSISAPRSDLLNQVGAASYRQLRWDGKTPLPKPIVLPSGVNGQIPSRDTNRPIPYRMFKPEKGESKGIHLHIHGGGWVLQSEA